jgi:hypothetical protein
VTHGFLIDAAAAKRQRCRSLSSVKIGFRVALRDASATPRPRAATTLGVVQ